MMYVVPCCHHQLRRSQRCCQRVVPGNIRALADTIACDAQRPGRKPCAHAPVRSYATPRHTPKNSKESAMTQHAMNMAGSRPAPLPLPPPPIPLLPPPPLPQPPMFAQPNLGRWWPLHAVVHAVPAAKQGHVDARLHVPVHSQAPCAPRSPRGPRPAPVAAPPPDAFARPLPPFLPLAVTTVGTHPG